MGRAIGAVRSRRPGTERSGRPVRRRRMGPCIRCMAWQKERSGGRTGGGEPVQARSRPEGEGHHDGNGSRAGSAKVSE